MLQHKRNDLCLPRNPIDSFESIFLVREIKRIVYSIEQSSDVVVTFKLFQEGLSKQP